MLRGGIEDSAPTRIEARHRRRKDHAAFSLQELGQRRFGSQQAAFHIHCELLIAGFTQLLLREIDEGGIAVEDAGVTYEDVEPTECCDSLLHRPFIVLE